MIPSRSSDLVITRMITGRIGLHSVLLPVLIMSLYGERGFKLQYVLRYQLAQRYICIYNIKERKKREIGEH